jgi:hypothetical protein
VNGPVTAYVQPTTTITLSSGQAGSLSDVHAGDTVKISGMFNTRAFVFSNPLSIKVVTSAVVASLPTQEACLPLPGIPLTCWPGS